jgi:hypothetical protein
MGGRVGSEGEVMFFGSFAHAIEHDAGLYAGLTALHIEIDNAIDIFGKIEHNGHVATLAGKAGAGAARENRCVKLAAGGYGGFDICGVERKHEADGELAIVGGIGGVEGATAGVEADLAAYGLAKRCFQIAMGGKALVGVEVLLFDENGKLRLGHFISSICWTSKQGDGRQRLN